MKVKIKPYSKTKKGKPIHILADLYLRNIGASSISIKKNCRWKFKFPKSEEHANGKYANKYKSVFPILISLKKTDCLKQK